MTRKFLTTAAFAGLMGLGMMASTGPASAFTERHCNSDGCWTVSCDEDGQYCRRVWDRDNYADRHRYTDTGYVRGNGYYDGDSWREYNRDIGRRQVCDADGDNCHWVVRSY